MEQTEVEKLLGRSVGGAAGRWRLYVNEGGGEFIIMEVGQLFDG